MDMSVEHAVVIEVKYAGEVASALRAPCPSGEGTPANGFTLLEMLISITLIALLMVGLVAGIAVGNKAWQRGEAQLRTVHAEGERAQFMYQQISSLVPYRVVSMDPSMPGEIFILEAGETCLRFLSTCGSHYWSRSPLLLVEYAVVRTPDGSMNLALRETPVRDDTSLPSLIINSFSPDPDTGKIEIVYQPFLLRDSDLRLMTGLRAAGFEYFGSRQVKEAPAWGPHWEARREAPYPEAVGFSWQRGNQGDELIIPIRARVFPK